MTLCISDEGATVRVRGSRRDHRQRERGGFRMVLTTNTLNQDLSDYFGPGVELVVSPVNNAGARPT
jgi:hypothetical protein